MMIEYKGEFEVSVVPNLLLLWLAVIFISLVFGMSRNDDQKQQHLHQGDGAGSGSGNGGKTNSNSNGFIPSSFRALSGYLRIVSSGASTVARSAAASVASSIVDRDDDADRDQVCMSVRF